MAHIKFITVQASSAPVLSDFYDSLQGMYGGMSPEEYPPNTDEYEIINNGTNVWELHLDEAYITGVTTLEANNKNIIDVEFGVFPFVLNTLHLTNNIIPTSKIDALIHYLTITEILIGVDFSTIGNAFKRSSSSNADADTLINSRSWTIHEDIILPTPTPTPTLTPTVTSTGRHAYCNTRVSQTDRGIVRYNVAITKNTRSIELHYNAYDNPDRFTIIQGSVSATTGWVGDTAYTTALHEAGYLGTITEPGSGVLVFNINSLTDVYLITESPLSNSALEFTLNCTETPSVITLAGQGIPADFGGNININSCSILSSTPTPTVTPTPTKYSGPSVITIVGSGKRGDKDGDSCSIIPLTPTKSAIKPAVITIAGDNTCRPGPAVSSTPTPTPTATFKGPRVFTIGGAGRRGDADGACSNTDPFPANPPAMLANLDFFDILPDPPEPSSTATPTPTLTPESTPEPTLSNTPTLTPTPTFTPSSTRPPHCAVLAPKVNDEPCCKEPATVPDHGSTTFNSRITSYVKLLNRCKSALGFPLIQLEITDEQIYNAIDISLEFFTKFGGYTEEYLIFRSDLYRPKTGLLIGDLFSTTPEMYNSVDPSCPATVNGGYGYDIDLNERRKVMDVFTVQPGDSSGINTLFTIEQTIAQQAYFGHLLGNVGFDLITFDVLKIWLKTREKVLALKPSFRFYPEKQLLRITPEPTLGSAPYYGIIGAYVQKPIRELISQLWIYKYTMAQIKITMGHVRGKYSGTNLYGSGSINAADVMSQGIKEMDELEKELKTDLIDREPIPFFMG